MFFPSEKSKAIFSINGIKFSLLSTDESKEIKCLLKERRYSTVYFLSAEKKKKKDELNMKFFHILPLEVY